MAEPDDKKPLPSERPEHKKQISQFGLQQQSRHQIIGADKDGREAVLADVTVMGGGFFRGDLIIAVNNDRLGVKLDAEGLKIEGIPDVKIVRVSASGKDRMGEPQAVGKVAIPTDQLRAGNKPLEGIFLHTPETGSAVSISTQVAFDKVESHTGSLRLTIDAVEPRAVPLRVVALDKKSSYDIVLSDLPKDTAIDVGQARAGGATLTRMKDKSQRVDLGIVENAASATLGLAEKGKAKAKLELYTEGKPGSAFQNTNNDPAKKPLEILRDNATDAMLKYREPLPPSPVTAIPRDIQRKADLSLLASSVTWESGNSSKVVEGIAASAKVIAGQGR